MLLLKLRPIVGFFAEGRIGFLGLWPGGSPLNPLDQCFNLVFTQFAIGGHFKGLPANRLNQTTLIRLANHNRCARLAPTNRRHSRVELQPPFHRFRLHAVARKAVFMEERPDFCFKKFQIYRGGLCGIGERCRQQCDDHRQTRNPVPHHTTPKTRSIGSSLKVQVLRL